MTTKADKMSVTHDAAEGTVTWTIGALPPVVLHTAKAHADMAERAMYHGYMARGSDRAAIARDPKTGASASAAEKREAIARWVAHVESGTSEWELPRGAAVAPRPTSVLWRAIVDKWGDTAENLKAYRALTPAERVAMAQHSDLRDIIADIEREDRAAAALVAPEAAALLAGRFGVAPPKAE